MARYTESKCRLCRREGTKLFLKGDRCFSGKCAVLKRPTLPGQHGLGSRKKPTEYCMQLREKQKTKRLYGLAEKQFRNYYVLAERMRGITGENMLQLLERRLDNIVYRMGIGVSRAESRQIVTHGHITVNGKLLNIPSYLVKKGDVISIKENKRGKEMFKELKQMKKPNLPNWLDFSPEKLTGKVLDMPKREDMDLNIAEHMIVELYSK
jgi:small subunit ribosomal protein S4